MQKNPIFYRISQFTGFLLGIRFFVTLLLAFALYVSTFFLFNQEEGLREFVFDFKVHGIIFCALLSIICGGIINQFYDKEKDQVTKPFRSRLQSFISQKYFLYLYLFLAATALIIAWLISPRVFVFFAIYQFFMWFYSHKLSKILIVNNLVFVALTLYPFFGMLIYYQTFSLRIFFMAMFIFLIILAIDIVKDALTRNADRIFGYNTIPNFFGLKIANMVITGIFIMLVFTCSYLGLFSKVGLFMKTYFFLGIPFLITMVFFLYSKMKSSKFYLLNLLRIWVFVGILMMLADGLRNYF